MKQPNLPFEVTPLEVKLRIDSGEPVRLIDVREPHEFERAGISSASLIPMLSVPAQLQEIEAMSDEAPLVVFCHRGIRSLIVVSWLRAQGVAACQSMSGGIDRWSAEIDPSVPRY
jgi:rhodanese-related sulfurtransferase